MDNKEMTLEELKNYISSFQEDEEFIIDIELGGEHE